MYKEYRKTATVMAKLFEKGDEDGMIAIENDKEFSDGDEPVTSDQPRLVPYVSTLENQKHRGEFGEYYICKGIAGERWLVKKEIFENTYELVMN